MSSFFSNEIRVPTFTITTCDSLALLKVLVWMAYCLGLVLQGKLVDCLKVSSTSNIVPSRLHLGHYLKFVQI